MRRYLRFTIPIATLAILMLAGPVAAQSAAPGAGIYDSAHDFTRFNTVGGDGTNVEDVGLCTFCHTPHKAIETQLLWNHKLSINSFDWSDSTTTQGGSDRAVIATTWAGPTKFCLSCHDGTVAIGDINWFDKATWTGAGSVNTTTHDAPDPYNIADGGELLGNHPVAHPFPFGGVASTYNTSTNGALAVASGWISDPQTLGIRLFTNTAGSQVKAGVDAGSTTAGIECSSCHDPHNGNGKVFDKYLLRGMLTGNQSGAGAAGYICLKCHVK